jgi:hypothetical protein
VGQEVLQRHALRVSFVFRRVSCRARSCDIVHLSASALHDQRGRRVPRRCHHAGHPLLHGWHRCQRALRGPQSAWERYSRPVLRRRGDGWCPRLQPSRRQLSARLRRVRTHRRSRGDEVSPSLSEQTTPCEDVVPSLVTPRVFTFSVFGPYRRLSISVMHSPHRRCLD